ncbi:MAG: HEAT repeat domain-containing protein, partial [Myxococcaceae bacterium]|nr:HEAT repeat domain-containing protein [Myxococcaceae bacterium]
MTWADSDPAAERRYRAVAERALEPGALPELVEALFDESWRVRRLAAERLVALRQPDALLAPLLEVLGRRGQPGARNAAAAALVHLGPVAIGPLQRLLRHDDPDQRKFAADILGGLGLEAASPALVAALDDADPNVQVAAAEALGKTGGPPARAALERLLSRGGPLLQVSALEALTALGAPPPLTVLVPLVEHPLTRRSAWRLVGRVQHRSAWVLMARHLGHSPARDAALLAMGAARQALPGDVEAELALVVAQAPDAAAWLGRCLASEDEERRVGALHLVRAARLAALAPAVASAADAGGPAELALAVLSSLGAAGAAALAVGGPPAWLSMAREARAVAGEALVEHASPRLVPFLVELLDAGEPELAEVAVRALGRAQTGAAAEPLARALDDEALGGAAARGLALLALDFPDVTTRALERRLDAGPPSAALVHAWAGVVGAGAGPRLHRALHDEAEAVRAAAAEEAGVVPAEAAALLGMAVVDESARVRCGAARAVGRLRGAEGRALLERLLDDPVPAVLARACLSALERGEAWAAPRLAALAGHPDAVVALAALQAAVLLGVV